MSMLKIICASGVCFFRMVTLKLVASEAHLYRYSVLPPVISCSWGATISDERVTSLFHLRLMKMTVTFSFSEHLVMKIVESRLKHIDV